jgi:glutamate synthase domain-containing protein 1
MQTTTTRLTGPPPKQGLYDPAFEHDACGVGFIVNIRGEKSHAIVSDALTILRNLDHRGAVGSEPNTGDGAGILIQIPDKFFRRACGEVGIRLPEFGQYGVGIVFTSPDESEAAAAQETFEKLAAGQGLSVLGWRELPTDNSSLGTTACASEPRMRQVFIERKPGCTDILEFERQLYIVRKRASKAIRTSGQDPLWFVASLSSRTIVYKGMLMPEQVDAYFCDLTDPDVESALALVHSRFSTNTFPSWDRSHPYRYIAHNGEINTLRGNINWMHARQSLLSSKLFGDELAETFPVINSDGSDSAMFDNCLELLTLSGRSLPHAVMMMIPEPWELHETMPDDKRAFYEFHSCLMEPWDGPASIAFTDGTVIGAILDRNGLRPSRYWVTKDGLVIMASEAGVLPIAPERVQEKGRLQPGRMFLVNTEEGRIVADEEIKGQIIRQHPYREWLEANHVLLTDLPEPPHERLPEHDTILHRQLAFGYTFEDQRVILGPMARDGVQPLGSMGTDTPLAVLSDRPVLLYSYFKQLFAQVTNPPIDPIREEIVTATVTMLGSEGNLLEPTPESCRMIKLDGPIINNAELEQIRHVEREGFYPVTLPILFSAIDGADGLAPAMDKLCAAADAAITEGQNILILSDRGVDADHVAIPALLAVSGLHHHLIRAGTRTKVSLVLESGEPREVHHFALLIGYGASAINPYLAFESLDDMIRQAMLPGIDHKTAVKNFVKAAVKGVVKTMAKMGISTVQSYRGAQIFEAVGLHHSVIDKYFCWTPSRVEGASLHAIGLELMRRHERAFAPRGEAHPTLDAGGEYQWRNEGEEHLFNPETIHSLQKAVRTGDYATFKKYAALVNDQDRKHFTLRGLLDFSNRTPIPIDEVDSVEEIMKRFKTGAMSYGSISKEAHEALAIAMNRVGGKSNTGEGGEDAERFTWTNENGDSKNSAIKQVASGRFGVTAHYLTNAREIQIKMAQGAKPGEGGELPGTKVYP